jgi:hypothetical protein
MTDKTMAKRKRTNGQTTINKALHKKLKIKQKNKTTKNPRMNPGAPEGFTVPVPHVVVVYFQVSISFHYYHGKIMHVTFDEIMMMS